MALWMVKVVEVSLPSQDVRNVEQARLERTGLVAGPCFVRVNVAQKLTGEDDVARFTHHQIPALDWRKIRAQAILT
jgi:hypothetical protein